MTFYTQIIYLLLIFKKIPNRENEHTFKQMGSVPVWALW